MDVYSEVVIVLVILAVIFLVTLAQFVWYFILILYYKSMD